MPLIQGEVRCVDEAINYVCLRYKIHLGSPMHDDIKQQLWLDVMERGLVQRHHDASQLKTWIIFCLTQTFRRVVTRWNRVSSREEIGVENRGFENKS